MSVSIYGEVLLQSYLHKRSNHLKLWKVRYFMLTKSELLYCKKSGQKPKERFCVQGIKVIDDQNRVTHERNHVIELRVGPRKIYISCATESEWNFWVKTIKAVQNEGSSSIMPEVRGKTGSRSYFDSIKAKTRNFNQRKQISKMRKAERRRSRLPKLAKSLAEIWIEDILPNTNSHSSSFVHGLCFNGIPKEVRGRVWSWILGNKLQINESLFQICKARAQAVRLEISLQHDIRVISEKDTQLDEIENSTEKNRTDLISQKVVKNVYEVAEKLVTDGERTIYLVNVDIPRTFGHHPLFYAGASGAERTREVLDAYVCYRPDLGYVQGMSYLAAIFCFHMDSFTAFKAMAALLSTSLLFDMFRLEKKRTFHYISVYEQIFEYELPHLFRHFKAIGMDPQMYAVDWALTLFTRCLPLHLALRIWDCFLFLGTPFFFQASMGICLNVFKLPQFSHLDNIGILKLYEERLISMDLDQMMRFLHNLPQTTSATNLIEAIDSVLLSCEEIEKIVAGDMLQWSPDSARHIDIQYPEHYE